MSLERQVQTEKEKAQQSAKDAKAKATLEDEVRRLQNQMEAQKVGHVICWSERGWKGRSCDLLIRERLER